MSSYGNSQYGRNQYGNSPNTRNNNYAPPVNYSEIIKKCTETFPVDKEAENFAKGLKELKITSAQLRRFYNDFKSLERKYEVLCADPEKKEDAFTSLLPQIKISKAKASYARARKTIPKEFETWLHQSVDKVNNADSFEKFLLHFEALVGFAYGAGLKDNK